MYFVEKTKGINFVKNFDYYLFFAVIVLSLVGLMAVSSAVSTMSSGSRTMTVQAISLILGVVLSIVISTIDYKDFKILGFIFYGLSVGLLVLVLLIGTGDSLGSRSWLNIKGISFQPSEISKIAFVIVLSVFLERIYDGQDGRKNNILKLIAFSVVPIGLVVAQRDYGTTMVFLFMLSVMIFICGIPYRYILSLIGTFALSTPFIWFFVLNEARKNRLRVFLDPELDPQGAGFNVLRSRLAIGSGQIWGKGLYEGIQTQNSMVPVKESDFIFSVIGEELGFIGTITVVLLVLFILIRCLYVAKKSRDTYGSFLVVGMLSMMGIHFVENMGMTIGILPVTGIPLPFVSAGGSAMITNYIALGVILSVSMRRRRNIWATDK